MSRAIFRKSLNILQTQPIIWRRVGIIRCTTQLKNSARVNLYIGNSEENPKIEITIHSKTQSFEMQDLWLKNWTLHD